MQLTERPIQEEMIELTMQRPHIRMRNTPLLTKAITWAMRIHIKGRKSNLKGKITRGNRFVLHRWNREVGLTAWERHWPKWLIAARLSQEDNLNTRLRLLSWLHLFHATRQVLNNPFLALQNTCENELWMKNITHFWIIVLWALSFTLCKRMFIFFNISMK